MRRIMASIAIVTGASVGCSGSSGGGGGGTVTTHNNGGSVSLTSSATSGVINAVFYKSSSPDPGVSLTYNDGHCVAVTGGTTATVTAADAGASIAFANGAASQTATKQGGGDYYFASASPLGAAGTWTMTAAGGADIPAGAIGSGVRFPAQIGGVVAPTITAGSTAAVTWTSDGADGVVIALVGGGGATIWACYVADNGSFTVPANVTTAVGSGASVTVAAADYGVITVNGRDVALIGETF